MCVCAVWTVALREFFFLVCYVPDLMMAIFSNEAHFFIDLLF